MPRFSPERIILFFSGGLWRIRETDLPRPQAALLRFLRIIVRALKGLFDDQCALRASALTLYSLLSIVPVLAMIFGIAKGFGFENALQAQLMQRLEGQEEVIERLITFSHSLLETTKGGLVAGVGLLLLFWAIIKMLANIETAFNGIWEVKQGRSLGRKVSDYLSLMLICPLLFMVASTLTVIVASQVQAVTQSLSLLGPASPIILRLLRLLPFLVIGILFSFLYAFIPNTRVQVSSAALGGFLSAAFYQIFQWIYITFQINVAKYNAIYGSFAALPLFLLWLQASWLIVLFGAEIAFAHQNAPAFEFGPDCRRMPLSFRKTLALAVTRLLVKTFSDEETRWTEARIAHHFDTPTRCVREVLKDLVEAGILSELHLGGNRPAAYQPARSPDILTIQYVLGKLEHCGSRDIPFPETADTRKIIDAQKRIEALGNKSEANVLLKDL